jgi:DNA helicase-2/ATP-dependent DNA helicase PcrA
MTAVRMLYGPPGTGKTTELLRRLEEALERGVNRSDIAYLSFTRAAADEALHRMGLKKSEKVCTIHAIVYRLLRLSKEQIVDTDKLQELASKIGIPITGATADSERELSLGDEFLALQQLAIARREDFMTVYEASHRPGNVRLFLYFCESYEKWKAANGYVDFNDMLVRYVNGRGPELKARIMFIDEAQDLSKLQWLVIERLAKVVEEVHIGGDDDQAIFEWSGADPSGMAAFERGHSAERTVLAQSWRLPKTVYELGNRVISRVRERVAKSYSPREAEGRITRLGHIEGLRHVGSEETLILYRNHSNRRELEDFLVENVIPYETMAGWTSPLQGKYGQALRTFARLRDGRDVAQSSLEAMKKVLTQNGRMTMRESGLPQLLKMDPTWAIDIPWKIKDYLRRVPIDTEVKVRLGSIHSAKGREADRVILYTAMGRRTVDSWQKNPDAEARVWYVGVTRSRERLDIVEGAGGYSL